MTDLERRALLGDRQAQEECTRQGIVLPCPKCGKNVQEYETVAELCCLVPGSDVYDNLKKYFGIVCNTLQGGCGIFVCGEKENDKKSALSEWNQRPAPPIGRCKDCWNTCPGKDYSYSVCVIHGHAVHDDGWCNEFEPKEGEENG